MSGIFGGLPNGWRLVTVADVQANEDYACVGGPFGSNLTRRDYVDAPGVPVIRGSNLSGKESVFLDDGFVFVSESKAKSLRQNMATPGDIIFTQRGTIGQVAEIPLGARFKKYVLSQSQMKLTVDPELAVSRYLCWFFRAPASLKYLESQTLATGVPHINLGILRSLPILLPTVPQQQRIAAILDKADGIRRKRKEAIALTEDLLRATFLDMFGDIPAKKSQWQFVPFRPYLSAASGKSNKGVLSAEPTDVPIYGGNGINGWATQALYKEPVIVVGRVGQQCGITQLTKGPAWVTDNAIVVTVERRDLIDPVYLATALQHSPLRASVMRLDLPFINQATILDYSLPLPPLLEQQRYVEVRKQVLKLQEHARTADEDSQALFSSLVHRAFRGEL